MKSALVVVGILGLGLLGAALALSGCKKACSPDGCVSASRAADEVTLGSAAMASGDYAAANVHYRQAVRHDPNNRQAQAGVAMTGIFLVQNDPEVIRILNSTTPTPRPATSARAKRDPRFSLLQPDPALDLGPTAMGLRVLRTFALAALNPVAVSDAQNVIKTHVMPQLQDAENRLNLVEADPNFTYALTVKVGTQTQTVEIDNGEIFMLDALINAVQGWLGLLVAYNFDVQNSDFENVKPDSLLLPGTLFGQLHPDGASQLSAAHASLLLVNTQFDKAVRSIGEETDDQTNDVITSATLQTPEFLDLSSQLDDIDATLRGPVPVEFTDYLGNPFPLQLRVGNFFVPGIADLKTKLPMHTFDVDHQFVLTSPLTFQDPKFVGIFPDMTNLRWQDLVGPSVAPRLLAHR